MGVCVVGRPKRLTTDGTANQSAAWRRVPRRWWWHRHRPPTALLRQLHTGAATSPGPGRAPLGAGGGVGGRLHWWRRRDDVRGRPAGDGQPQLLGQGVPLSVGPSHECEDAVFFFFFQKRVVILQVFFSPDLFPSHHTHTTLSSPQCTPPNPAARSAPPASPARRAPGTSNGQRPARHRARPLRPARAPTAPATPGTPPGP